MSNIKPPQHDLYERIGKVTIDGRTKAYKDVVARLQNAAEIRQQRKDAAALSQGHSDGHGTEMDMDVEEGIAGALATGALGAIGSYAGSKASAAGEKKIRRTKTGKEVLKKLDMGEDIDESPAAIRGIKMGGRLIKKGASQLRNPATRSMGKKTIGHGAKTAGKGISKSGAAAGTAIKKDANIVGKAISQTSAAKNVAKGIKQVTPKTALGRNVAKSAAKGAAVGGAAGMAVNKARTGNFSGKKRKTEESLAIEEAIEERVLEILSARGIVDESVAALKGIRRGGRIIRRGASQLRNPATRSAGTSLMKKGAGKIKTAASHANKATKAGAGVAGTYAAAAGLSQTKTIKKMNKSAEKANANAKKKKQ